MVNAVQHTVEQIQKYPNTQLRIGTDSQVYSDKTVYVTAITYRYGKRGVHYIYCEDSITDVSKHQKSESEWYNDEVKRLYDEGVRTIQTFIDITAEIPISFEALEFDYQEVLPTISKKLVSDFKGWVVGMGVRAIFKSGEQYATRAADHIIKRRNGHAQLVHV